MKSLSLVKETLFTSYTYPPKRILYWYTLIPKKHLYQGVNAQT